ncbi:arginine--tRNA ligase [Lentisphaerota bacterium WC36G]|nr:arginine--tRNA ligase [Lentisphaerae bacterium WC36]
MKINCIEELKKFLITEKFSELNLDDNLEIIAEACPGDMDGDITVNCFKFSRFFKQNPMAMAQLVVEYLENHSDVEKVEAIKAFVNVTLSAKALHSEALEIVNDLAHSVQLPKTETQKIAVEYSAPNTNKPQHLGHVRNNTLGMALASLLARVGHNVIPLNLVNDRGIHICKSMIAYQRFGNGDTPESTGTKGDHLVGSFYVKYNYELKKQLDELRSQKPEIADKTDDELFLQTEIGLATQKMLQDWENGDTEVRDLWQMMNNWVFAGFDETYKRMGCKFEHTYLESNTYLLGKDIIEQGLASGAFKRREDGAVVADLGKKMGEKVVLRSDGTSVYITQDIGTTIKKYDDYAPDAQVWVVGDEQILHFKQLFAIMKKLGYDWAKNLYHMAYGMVNLPTGKMKSREGTVVDADDLFDEMVNLAKEATLSRCGDEVPIDIDERSEIIGLGALKFMLLKFNPKTTIMFDPQASIKFEGDTGPYVQYAVARISSIFRKAEEEGISVDAIDCGSLDWSELATDEEKNVSTLIAKYPETLQYAASKKDCSVVVSYLLDLAKAFNKFYRECPVMIADTDELKVLRLALCNNVKEVLVDGLKTLTIDCVTEM